MMLDQRSVSGSANRSLRSASSTIHDDDSSSQLIAVDSESPATNLSIAVNDDIRGGERSAILVSLALEFLADRGMDELFEVIWFKPGTCPNCRSSGAVTELAMTSGLAPG